MITLGGVALLHVTDALRTWVEQNIDPALMPEFSTRHWPGKNLTHLPFRPSLIPPAIRLNSLYWPTGASRFAVGHFLCDEARLADLRDVVYPVEDSVLGYDAADLTISDGTNSVTASMWMLPPRPLADCGENGLYLLTLVDERYFWWSKATALSVTGGTTTWATLYASIATALGITLTVDDVAAAYLKPPASLGTKYEALPIVLDAVAYCVGQRIVRQLDGTVRAWNADESLAACDAWLADDLPELKKLAGGVLKLGTDEVVPPGTLGVDNLTVLPASVIVAYPRTDTGVLSATPYTVSKTLLALQLSEFQRGDGTYISGEEDTVKVFRASATATFTGGGTPTNETELGTLTGQISTDYYRYQAAKLDIALIGYPAYSLTGFDDAIHLFHDKQSCLTRIVRGSWDDDVEDLLYHGTGGSTSTPFGISVVELDGSPSYSGINTIIVDQTDGFVLSQPAAGQARIDSTCIARVSSNDTTPGFLSVKLVAGTGVTITENNNGANETLTIEATGTGSSVLIGVVDVNPASATATEIRFDEADGFVVANVSGTIYRVDLQAATDTQAGIVSIVTQTYAGLKTYLDGIISSFFEVTAISGAVTNYFGSVLNDAGFCSQVSASNIAASIFLGNPTAGTWDGELVFGVQVDTGDDDKTTLHLVANDPANSQTGRLVLYVDGLALPYYSVRNDATQKDGMTAAAAAAIVSTEVAGGLVISATSLSDPNADRILFWDDSGGAVAWLTAGAGLTITTTTIKASEMAAWTVKVRNAGTTGDPSDAALADFTEEASPAAGDFLIGFLNTGELRKFDVDNMPSGGGVADADYGDVTVSGSGATWTIDANVVSNTKLADMASWTYKIRNAGSSGDPSDAALADFTTEAAPAAGDFLVGFLASGEIRKFDIDALPASVSVGDIIFLRDIKTQNTAGGTFTTGAWRTRDLNTETIDDGNHCVLTSNQFALNAGTYEIWASAPAFQVNQHQARLQNITDTVTTLVGTTEYSNVAGYGMSASIIVGRFVIASSKTFEIQHQGAGTVATQGFGLPANFTTEIYTQVFMRKVS